VDHIKFNVFNRSVLTEDFLLQTYNVKGGINGVIRVDRDLAYCFSDGYNCNKCKNRDMISVL